MITILGGLDDSFEQAEIARSMERNAKMLDLGNERACMFYDFWNRVLQLVQLP